MPQSGPALRPVLHSPGKLAWMFAFSYNGLKMSLSSRFGQTSLQATCAEEFNPLVEDLFGLIRQSVAKGAVLRAGVRIPFGWTVLTVRGEPEELALWEPDFDANPTQLRENLDFSLAGYRRQQHLIAAVGLDHWRPLTYSEDVLVE